ncbi:MAG TPA: AMP-binding protein [Solirubrobacterales bacterium]|nr:AMP-binding protein [Solirubrobacterales bacterium]
MGARFAEAAPDAALARWSQLTLGEIVRRQAHRRPTAVAIEWAGTEVTYGELHGRAEALGNALAELGVGPGDRVAIRLHNCLEMVESLFACHLLGAVAVPINMRLTATEVEYMVGDCEASLAIADEQGRALGEGWPDIRWLTVGGAGAESYEEAIRSQPARALELPVDDDDAAFIVYTSGTTGRPKGAVLTHKNFVTNALSFIFEIGVRGTDVWTSPFPLFHVGGLVGLYPFLLVGTRINLLPSVAFDPAATLAALGAASMCAMVPMQWELVLAEAGADQTLGGIKRAIWGAAPASRPLLERMQEALGPTAVVCTFGQTEVTANATFLRPEDSLTKIGSVGRPALTVEHRVVDAADADVAPGEVGEIVYRGPTVMRGYWHRPEATAEAFGGGWFHSGDLVREDDDGYLYVVDRKKDLIISGGENVYPAEVERVLLEDPAVADVAVVGVDDERWGERPVAYVVARGELTAGRLIDACDGKLARYKIPGAVVFVDELPRNSGGKVLKRELRERPAGDLGPRTSQG